MNRGDPIHFVFYDIRFFLEEIIIAKKTKKEAKRKSLIKRAGLYDDVQITWFLFSSGKKKGGLAALLQRDLRKRASDARRQEGK